MSTEAFTDTTYAWRDGKRHWWLMGVLVSVLPYIGAALALSTGWDVFWFTLPIYSYIAIPILDVLMGEDPNNAPESAVAALEDDPYYRRVLLAYLPTYIGIFLGGAWLFVNADLSWIANVGVIFTVGFAGAGAINVAHEIGHKRGEQAAWLAKLALATTAYGHFYVEHNRGHHPRVATPQDPASARLGESLYRFVPRSVFGGVRSAWRLESERLAEEGRSVWDWRNHNLQAWALSVVLFAGLISALGWAVLPFLLIQAAISISVLEVVNYLEHYGLLRQKKSDGTYERAQPEHSWNSNHLVSNLNLYHIQRHSDHHAYWSRGYQALRHHQGAPQLPAGYTAMMLLAAIPPLWRAVMDKRVMAHYGGDRSLANTL